MENLVLSTTATSPGVKLNAETGICEISGESYMENSVKFYEPVFTWFNDYFQKVEGGLHLILKIEYMNTSSMKHVYNLILLIKKFQDKGLDVKVEWHYDEDETDLEEDITDIADESGMYINMVAM